MNTDPIIQAQDTSLSVTVRDHQTALLFRHGQFQRVLAPGKHRLWSFGHEVRSYDTREQILTVQGQELLTSDQILVKISAVVVYQIADALLANRKVQSPSIALYGEIQLALRQIVAVRTSEDFLANKAGFAKELQELLATVAAGFGVSIARADVRDVMLPAELKRSFMSGLQQRQEANALLEKARAETAALRTLANAAKIMRDNPELLQLRYLDALKELSGGINNTIVLGLTDADKLRQAITIAK